MQSKVSKYEQFHRRLIFQIVQISPHVSFIINTLRNVVSVVTNWMFKQVILTTMWRLVFLAIFILSLDVSSCKKTRGQKTREKIEKDWDFTTTLYGIAVKVRHN